MEEPPLIAEWDKLTGAPNVVVVPFFVSDGLHTFEDIPALLGIEDSAVSSNECLSSGGVFRANPHRLHGRSLYYARAIGTDAGFADAIIEQALNLRSVAHAD
jgi:CbiX.